MVNANAQRLFGYSRDALVGQPIEVLVPEAVRGEHVHQRSSYAAAPVTRPMGAGLELSGRKKDGAEFPAEISLSPMRSADGDWVIAAVRDVTERKKAEATRRALQQKDLLLKEIHHRVKNNLQVISSLLKLEAEKTPDPSTRVVLEDSQQRIRTIALLHEQLYQTTHAGEIDMDSYVRDLCVNLVRAGSGETPVELRALAPGVLLDVEAAMPCGLMINELVTNALKHAFVKKPGRGHVSVELYEAGGTVTLTVADDGVGLPEHVDLKARKPTSLGLYLVDTLTRQLRGTVRFEREGGTRCVVTFPRTGAR
jgi:PAS domain S-box-containing protein